MTTKNTGGTAFPSHCRTVQDEVEGGLMYRGMTLRDYFAAKALIGLVFADARQNFPAHVIARESYELADAMIAEREK